MLHKDYLLEIISRFVESVSVALKRALFEHDMGAAQDVEDSVAALLDLDPSTAMSLSPDSLVTMLILSGIGDSLASYVAYALDKVGDAYDDAGDGATAALRWDQAEAIAESFGCDQSEVPPEFAELDGVLSAVE